MAVKDRVTIELYVDDQGMVKIRQATAATKELSDASTRGSAESKAAAEGFASSLAKQLGIYALITAAAWKTEQTLVSVFKSGIKAVDEYQVRVIGIAATLTNLAKPGQGNFEEVFRRNKVYAEDMYRAINIEAAKHFATANEGMTVYNRLVQSGYAARLQEVGALMTLTDKIKLATQGQDVERQLNTEIMALMEGQMRPGSMMAMELQQRLGPGWANLVEKHRQAGDLVTWLASLYPGLSAANKEIEGTITAQWATTKSLLDLLAIGGLTGAYKDIAGWLKDINDYLRTHEELAGKVSKAWSNISGSVEGLAGFIAKAGLALVDFGAQLDKIAQNPALMAIIGAAAGSRLGPWGAFAGGAAGLSAAVIAQGRAESNREIAAMGVGPYGEAAETFYEMPKGPPPTIDNRKKQDTGGGGGAGMEGQQRKIENLIDSLQKEWAQLSQGSLAQTDAWGAHVRREIERVEGFSEEKSKALTLVSQVEALKKGKIEQDFYSWAAKESGDHYATLTDKANSWLHKVQGNADAAKGAMEIYFADLRKQREKDNLEILGLQKSQLDALAGALPFLGQQLAVKERILPLEAEISRLTLERKLRGLDISEALKDELRGYQALTAQAKKYALVREGWARQGAGGGISLFALDLRQESETAVAFGVRDGLKSAKGMVDQSLTDLIMSPFTKKKMDFKKMGLDAVNSFVSGWAKIGTTRLFSFFTDGALGMVNTWETAQKTMTAASLAGDTARTGAMAAGLSQGTGLLTMAAKANILVEAGQAGAAGFKSVMEAVPFPFNIVLAPITAAAAFAATLAFGSGLGGGGGGMSSLGLSSNISPQISHEGSIVAHRGLLVAHDGLALDERLIKAQVGEWIINRDATAELVRQGVTFDMINNGRMPVAPLPVPVGAFGGGGGNGPQKLVIPLTINQVDNRGQVTSAQQYKLTVDLVNKAIEHNEIRIPAGRH